jgi:hypothetical protein
VATLTAATKLHAERKSLEHDSLGKVSLEHNKLVEAKDIASKTLHDVLIRDSYLESDDMQSLMNGLHSSRPLDLKDFEPPLIVEADQGVAFISSVFSALLSTLVAMIAWEAKVDILLILTVFT